MIFDHKQNTAPSGFYGINLSEAVLTCTYSIPTHVTWLRSFGWLGFVERTLFICGKTVWIGMLRATLGCVGITTR